jgi:hypothetical protein
MEFLLYSTLLQVHDVMLNEALGHVALPSPLQYPIVKSKFICMYVCIYIHTHTHIYIHTYTHTHTHTHMHACMHTHAHAKLNMSKFERIAEQ